MSIQLNDILAGVLFKSAEHKPPPAMVDKIKTTARTKAEGLLLTPAMGAVINYMPSVVLRSREPNKYATDRKGLLMIGGPGLGKSIAAQFMAALGKIEIAAATDAARIFATEGEAAFYEFTRALRKQETIIDDLGAEREVMSFGNSSPMADWLQDRYSAWQIGGPVTHIVTNLSPEQIGKKYGPRVLDRVQEFTTPTPLAGKSLRINKPQPQE